MRKSERYWMNAAIYLLLSDMLKGDTFISAAAVVVCYLLSVGYFCAMVWTSIIKGESQ